MNNHSADPIQLAPIQNPLERAFHVLQDAILILDRNSEIAYMNKVAEQGLQSRFGRIPQVGDLYLDLVPESRKTKAQKHISFAFCNEATSYNLAFQEGGEEAWFEVDFLPMPDDHGEVTHVCVRAKNITRQIKLEKELELEKEAQKNLLIKAALDAQEKQRSEIGRELHDNVNQVLTTIKLYNEICLTEEQTNKKLLLRSVQQINYCIETLRALSKTLSSPSIEDTNLKDSIKELVDEVTATRRINAKFLTYGVQEEMISQDLQTTLYRIAQEQLTNVLKYADASTVEVMLVGTSKSIAVKIEDDGVGFDPKQKRAGVGITNMITRAETMGGTVEIHSSPGKGCSLMAEFPLQD